MMATEQVKTWVTVSQGYWGKGASLKIAQANMRKEGWRKSKGCKVVIDVMLLSCEPGEVKAVDMGHLSILYPLDCTTMRYELEV